MIDIIEDAIKDRIKAAEGMKYLKTVATYAGEFDDDLAYVVRSYPAVWVVYAGGPKPKKIAAEKWLVRPSFAVMVGARNVRNEAATRKGDPINVGTYQILKDVRTSLLNQDLGLEIERFEPGAERVLFNTKVRSMGLSVMSQEWSTAYIQHAASEEVLHDLLSVGLNYFIKPGDDVVDASDEVTLTQ